MSGENNFVKKNNVLVRWLLILAGIIFTSGLLVQEQRSLRAEIGKKVDKELYEQQIKSLQKQLDRIEAKIDNLAGY
jgi:hypothetical protein